MTANPTTYAIDTATFTLNAPTKLGYTFGGWYSEDTFVTQVTEIATGSTGNKTFYAKWTAIEYGITYNLNDGVLTGTYPTTYTIDKITTLVAPTKLGYTFSGWFGQADFSDTPITEIAIGSTENKTFYANWTINTYTIQFNSNGGGTITDTTYNMLTMPSSFAAPAAKTGYTFAAWYDNATLSGSPITAITLDNIGNKTLYAKWTAIVYGITYEPNSGTLAESYPKTYTIETETTLVGATRANYTFLGWCDNVGLSGSVIKTIPTGEIGDKKFYAKWEPVSYGITYELNGGSSANNPDTYTIEDSTIQLQAPTHGKNWMTFGGWFEDDKFATQINQILTSPTGNKKVYAKWNFTGTPGLTYTKVGETYEVSGRPATGAIGIPSKYSNLPVNIAANAFKDNKNITSVIIDEGVTSIGDDAFNACIALTSANLPSNLKVIPRGIFLDCKVLASVNIPSKVVSIKDWAFANCAALTSVTIPSSVETIGEFAFVKCTSIMNLIIQDGVKSIGSAAFSNIPMLSVFVPITVETMAVSVFDKCWSVAISCAATAKPVGWNDGWYGYVGTDPSKITWGQTRPIVTP